MAPKRSKRTAQIDLTGDDDDYAPDESHRPKRRRVNRRQDDTNTPVSNGDPAGPGPGSAGAGPSSPAEAPKAPARSKRTAQEVQEQRVNDFGRTVKYRPTASREVQERIARAMPGSAHRMFLVDTVQLAPPGAEGGPSQEFHVLGATGNVYTVRISRQPRCSCPDFAKGHLCKHILFVMLRVLRQSPQDPIIWQRCLLNREVEQVLGGLAAGGATAAAGGTGAGAAAAGAAGVVMDQSVLASERVRQRYAAIMGTAAGGAAAGGSAGGGVGSVQRPVEGECPICFEAMVPLAAGGDGGGGRAAGSRGRAGGGGEAIVFCHSCGNNMHNLCFERWASSKRSSGQAVTCVYCRAPWHTAGGGGGGGGAGTPGGRAGSTGGGEEQEYVNLSQYSDAYRGGGPSLEDLYGSNAYFIRAASGEMSRRQAARLHAAARGWA